jgi:hypothetical protein
LYPVPTKLAEVGVSGKVLERVESLAEKTEGLVLSGGIAVLLEAAALLDTAEEGAANERLGCVPVSVLWELSVMLTFVYLTIRNVVLHSRLRINLELAIIDRTSKTRVECLRIIGVSLRVVNVLGREVAAETLLCDLKFLGGVAVREEAENHDQVENRLQGELAEASSVDRLCVRNWAL